MSDLNRTPLSGGAFWRLVDARLTSRIRRLGQPVRGVLASVNAAGKGLLAQFTARADETVDGVELAQHFGFRSVAPKGLEVIAVPIGGSSAHLVILGEIDRSTTPPSLTAGEAALYSSGGATVIVRADGSVEISGTTIKLNGPGPAAARVGDPAAPGPDMASWISGVSTATGVPAPPNPSYQISSGSSTVQAGG